MLEWVAADLGSRFDSVAIVEAVNKYRPLIEAYREIGGTDALKELLDGTIVIPDSVTNLALAGMIAPSSNIKEAKIRSTADGKITFEADTTKLGRIEFSGKIEKFVHNKDESQMQYKVEERELKDQGLLSWIVSRIPVSYAEKLFGKVDLGDNLTTSINGNTVTVDFATLLQTTKLASVLIDGTSALDLVEVKEIEPRDGAIAVKVGLNLPDNISELLKSFTADKAEG